MSDDSDLSYRLGQAIHNGELEHVRIYIEQGVDVNRQCYSKWFPLALACRRDHGEIMEDLLKAGADPNQVSGWLSLSAMLMAANERHLTLSMMRCLISYEADVNLRDDRGKTILHILAFSQFNDTHANLLSAAKLVLDSGGSFYALDVCGRTPLYEACRSGNIDLVKLFIAEGADVNIYPALLLILRGTAASCNIDMFDLLLNAGANRRLTPKALVEPCAKNDDALIARILDTCDVDINMALDHYGDMTILQYACRYSRITSETVRLLLDRGADVRAVSDTGDTALHYAVELCNCNKIRQLLSYKNQLDIRNNKNQSPLLKVTQGLIPSKFRMEYERYRTGVVAFKMLVTAGATITTDVEHRLNQLRLNHPDAQLPECEIIYTRSLKEMCRFVIRGAISVPVDISLCTLPIPKLVQEYLNFSEFDSLVKEYIKINEDDIDDDYTSNGDEDNDDHEDKTSDKTE